MNKDAFSGFHPAVNLAFFVAVLGMTMFIQQPIYLLVSILSGCAYLFYLQGRKKMLRQVGYLLPILIMMAVINPIFNHEGVTVLWYLHNDNPITLEAICYGIAYSVMMGASVVWFNCLNTVFTSDKIIYLFGRVVPALSLMISMTLRFVPRFKNFLQNVMSTQKAMHKPENKKEKLKQALLAFSATVSWAMEQSIVSSDSMKSRGFGLKGRTAFSIYLFEKRDKAAIVVLLLLCIGASAPYAMGYINWKYYPSLAGTLIGPIQAVAYVCYAVMCLFPLIIDLTEDHKWNSLRSKI